MSCQQPSTQSLDELLNHRIVGDVVNYYVLEYAEEPKPDFAEMEKTLRTFGSINKSRQRRAEPRQAVPETD